MRLTWKKIQEKSAHRPAAAESTSLRAQSERRIVKTGRN
jgi:hypothetical protein